MINKMVNMYFRCPANATYEFGVEIACFTLEQFKEKVRTENVTNYFFWFTTKNTTGPKYFWTAQQDFYA